MTTASTFELKVALVGNVSVGKTTMMNALFGEKYSEVSKKRTTAGVNYFRVWKKRRTESGSETSLASSNLLPGEIRSAESTLMEIVKDNECLRREEVVKDKVFEIKVEKDIFEMRADTKLVVVDIPGLNENGASQKYKDYVNDKWGTFDCVVVVMDGGQGVNTEEQVSLLKFVKSNCDTIRDIPVIILLNKIDDMFDEDQADLVCESKREIEKLFSVDNRDVALDRLLKLKKSSNPRPRNETGESLYPVVIPISGISGFIFRCYSSIPIEKFRDLDRALIAKLGRNRVGQVKWDGMNEEERIESAHQLVNDPALYKAGLRGSNFDKFLEILEFTLGGSRNQHVLIEKQIEYALKSLSSTRFADGVRKAYDLVVRFFAGEEEKNGADILYAEMKDSFWRLYTECKENAFEKLKSPSQINGLSAPAVELREYCLFAREIDWKVELERGVIEFESLARRLKNFILSEETMHVLNKAAGRGKKVGWDGNATIDWFKIFGSLNLLSYNKFFCQKFGREKLILDLKLFKYTQAVEEEEEEKRASEARRKEKRKCPHCKTDGKYTSCYNKGEGRCVSCGIVLFSSLSLVSHPRNCGYYSCPKSSCEGLFKTVQKDSSPEESYKCRKCGDKFHCIDVESEINCTRCNKFLIFGLFCKDCKIYYRPHASTECLLCDGFLEADKESQPARCTKCHEIFYELPPLTEQFQNLGTVKVPDSMSDPNHFGHVAWLYCDMMEKLGELKE